MIVWQNITFAYARFDYMQIAHHSHIQISYMHNSGKISCFQTGFECLYNRLIQTLT